MDSNHFTKAHTIQLQLVSKRCYIKKQSIFFTNIRPKNNITGSSNEFLINTTEVEIDQHSHHLSQYVISNIRI